MTGTIRKYTLWTQGDFNAVSLSLRIKSRPERSTGEIHHRLPAQDGFGLSFADQCRSTRQPDSGRFRPLGNCVSRGGAAEHAEPHVVVPVVG